MAIKYIKERKQVIYLINMTNLWNVYVFLQYVITVTMLVNVASLFTAADSDAVTMYNIVWLNFVFCFPEITCDRQDFPVADILNYKEKYNYHERATYLCKDGYKGRFYLTCGENGWDGDQQCRGRNIRTTYTMLVHFVNLNYVLFLVFQPIFLFYYTYTHTYKHIFIDMFTPLTYIRFSILRM